VPEIRNPDSWYGLLTGRTFLQPALRRLRRSLRDGGVEHEARSYSAVFAYDLPAKPYVREGLERLIARGVRLLLIFGGGEHHYYNYRDQFLDAFPGLDFGDLLELEHLPTADHMFSSLPSQAWLDARIERWLMALQDRRYADASARTASSP